MENVLIVTVGTRDIQVSNQKELNFRLPNFTLYENKNILGYKFFTCPLEAGNKIIEYHMQDLVEYPIIKPAIDYVLSIRSKINKLILICTDQKFAEKRFRDLDTIYFAQIIEKLIRKQYSIEQIESIHQIEIDSNVTNYGKMYDFFDQRLPQILKKNDSCNLYIYPQGGIDAINFQALLKCIELFPNTFHLYKSESNNDIEPSDFPKKFRTNMESQKIPSLIDKFYYHEVYSSDPYIKLLTAYSQERLMLNFEGAFKVLDNANIDTPLIEMLKSRAQDLFNLSLNNEISYLKDFYLSIKIAYRKQDYSAFLLKIYALCESFLKDEACIYLKVENYNTADSDAEILYKIKQNDLLKSFILSRNKSISLNSNNYLAVCEFFDSATKCNHLFIKKTISLKYIRNNIAHTAKNFAVNEIQDILLKIEPTIPNTNAIDQYFNQGDEFWGVSGFGDYEIINEAIRTRLTTNKTT